MGIGQRPLAAELCLSGAGKGSGATHPAPREACCLGGAVRRPSPALLYLTTPERGQGSEGQRQSRLEPQSKDRKKQAYEKRKQLARPDQKTTPLAGVLCWSTARKKQKI